MKYIHLISGPRNISTALMYSFGNRMDTSIIDEPFYAYYLTKNKIDYHPGTKEIINAQPKEYKTVVDGIFNKFWDTPYVFIKNMAHHLINTDLSFLNNMNNVFLIREPAKLIASFSKVIEEPSMLDIGLKLEYDILKNVLKTGAQFIVVDSSDILNNPKAMLSKICDKIQIPFDQNMLSWPAGPRKADGVWAKYWYKSVHKSTGFINNKAESNKLPERLYPLLEEANRYYYELHKFALKV